MNLLCISREKKTTVRGKVCFLDAGIWFDVKNCTFILKNNKLKCLLCFPSIFAAGTQNIEIKNCSQKNEVFHSRFLRRNFWLL